MFIMIVVSGLLLDIRVGVGVECFCVSYFLTVVEVSGGMFCYIQVIVQYWSDFLVYLGAAFRCGYADRINGDGQASSVCQADDLLSSFGIEYF